MKAIIRLFTGFMAAFLIGGCATPGITGAASHRLLNRYQKSFLDAFDTVTIVTLYEMDEAEAEAQLTQAHEKLLYYHKLFDIYHTYDGMNNLCSVNKNAGVAPVRVDAALIELLIDAKQMGAFTGGRMKIAMGSVLSIWHDAREAGISDPERAAIPPMEQLREAARHIDIERLIIDEQAGTVYLADDRMRLDVGAIAKGYAAQKTADWMVEECGVTSMLLNIGGNVCAVGSRGDGTPWKVAVQSPENPQETLCTLAIDGMSLVTSGTYQRYYTVDGVRYHHIIDPKTLLPSTYFESVTVLSKDSVLGDALSTALFNMPLDEGVALVESMPDVEALWVDAAGKRTLSCGFEAYLAPD